MVDFSIVFMTGNKEIITDFYIKHKTSSAKRRLLGQTGEYDTMGVHSLNYIVNNSKIVYLYNSFKEVDGYKLGIQELIDMDIDLDKIITMEKNTGLKYIGDTNIGINQRLLKILFSGEGDFEVYREKLDSYNILKYCAASFSKIYGTIHCNIHRDIREKAMGEFKILEDNLYNKYGYKENKQPFTLYLKKLETNEAMKDRQKYLTARRASQGLSVSSVINKSETLYFGHITHKVYNEYMKLVDREYKRIRIDYFGYPITIQNGQTFELYGLTLKEKYKHYINVANKVDTSKSYHKLHRFLLELIKTMYDNNVYISECNIQYIEFAIHINDNIRTKVQLIKDILEKSGYNNLFRITNAIEGTCTEIDELDMG